MAETPIPVAPIPIAIVSKDQLTSWREGREPRIGAWLNSVKFKGEEGSTALVPDAEGNLALVVQGMETGEPLWAIAGLPDSLPAGRYKLDDETVSRLGAEATSRLVLGWNLGSHAFTRYKKRKAEPATLEDPAGIDLAEVQALSEALTMARDLVDTPAEDLGPQELATFAKEMGQRHGAQFSVIEGADLLAQNYPMIHAVGRASHRPPCLVDMRWGDESHPKVTLVGKGVCFDTGGLDLKPSGAMKLMKKDMGGAATVLGLAHALMAAKTPIRLRVLVPAVDNAVAGDAFRPMDIFKTRKGLTVEIGNTDAEGRLILCDALAEAQGEEPELLIDMATLTGAARVALGGELPALFCNDDAIADELVKTGMDEGDPMWRLPLWPSYKKLLKSRLADLNNAPEGGLAGAITAALFLEAFIEPKTKWVHIDTWAWTGRAKPGRPEGGEGLCLRALYRYLRKRYQ